MIDIQKILGVANMPDLTINKIRGKCNTKHLTEKSISGYKNHGPKMINGTKVDIHS